MAKKKLNSKNSKQDSKKISLWSKIKIFLLILIVIVGLAAIFASLKGMVPNLLGGASLSGELAAKVNGEQITVKELDESYDRIPSQYKMVLSREQFLDQMIDNVLLRQEALSSGIVVSDFEAEQNVKEFMNESQITDEELRDLLKNKSLDYEELVRISRDQLLVQRVVAMKVTSQVEPTTADALEYYNQHPKDFTVPEAMTVRHILFATQTANRTLNQANAEAKEVLSMIAPAASNFCELVNTYTDDRASVSICGEYQFQEGQLPEEFDSWSENAKIGSVSIVDTPYGTHILLLVNRTPESYFLFKDVQAQILASLQRGDEQLVYNNFIAQLRNNSDIVIYLKEPADEEPEVLVSPEPVVQSQEPETMPESEDLPVENQATEVQDTPVSNEEVVAQTTLEDNSYLPCLLDKGAKLYGAKWDSSTTQQKNILGNDFEKINYIECSVEGDYKQQTSACMNAKIAAYPTWMVGSNKYMGVYTVEELAQAAGC